MNKPLIIAFYLPQFHPTPHNNEWWGTGFTEWTNVAKAKPLFKGHYQPKIPADLGFYDLRLSEVREQQAELAREAGVYGFCYWSYWFGNGKEELERPFNEVLASGEPDFPFMLCWANESWHSKFWNKDGTVEKKVLIEQEYPSDEDIVNYFNLRLPAFKDSRYIKIDNKPVFMIYEWDDYKDVSHFIKKWNELAVEAGFDGIYFLAHLKDRITTEKIEKIFSLGFDGMNIVRIWDATYKGQSFLSKCFSYFKKRFLGIPHVRKYKDISQYYLGEEEKEQNIFPTLIPNWDHSPRSGKNSVIITDSTPENFQNHCERVLESVKDKQGVNMVFIRAWNEWGEGNYMEPDLKYGKGHIQALRNALKKVFG